MELAHSGFRGMCSWFLVGFLFATTSAASAYDFLLESTGARLGFGANRSSDRFHNAEAFGQWHLPWNLDLGSKWRIDSTAEISAGWLGDPGANAAFGSMGPVWSLEYRGTPVRLEAGSSATLLSRSDFTSKDLGFPFQFTTHVGLSVDLGRSVRLGYRFQHMSNAGLGSSNPGLNLHLFALSYVF